MPFPLSRTTSVSAILLAGFLAAVPGWTQTPEPSGGIELTSEAPIEYDDRSGSLVARQNARLAYDDWLLVADEIRYNQTTGEAQASGHVVLMREGYRLLADKVTYWPKDKKAELVRYRMGQPPFHVAGEYAGGNIDDLEARNPHFYYGEPDSLAPRASARSLRYFGDNKFQADHLVVRLGPVPVFFAPGISGDIDSLTEPFLEGYGGYSSDLGAFLGLGVGIGIGPTFSVGGTLAYFSARGLLWGPLVRYRSQKDKDLMNGDFRLNMINDTGDRGVDNQGNPIDADRYFMTWDHREKFGEKLSLTALVNAWSDSEVTRDFRSSLFNRSQQPDTYAEATYRGSNYVASLFGRYQANDFFSATERLPEIRFDLMPTAIGAGFVNELQTSAARLDTTDLQNGTTLRSDRLDAYYGLTRAIKVEDWLTFTPVVGGRVTYYDKTVDNSGSYTRVLGEVGFDAKIQGYGNFDFENAIWEISGLRHLVNATFQYRYIPEAGKGRDVIPIIDRDVFSTSLPTIGLADIRPRLDDLHETNTLRIGFNNILQTRHQKWGSRNLVNLSLIGDIRFSTQPGEDDTSSIYALFGVTPADWLRARVYTRINPDGFGLDEVNTELWLVNQDDWELGIGTDFLKGHFQQYTLMGRYRFTDTFSVLADLHYNDKTGILTEASIRIGQNIHHLWMIEYGITFFDGPRRETGNRLEFGIRYLGF